MPPLASRVRWRRSSTKRTMASARSSSVESSSASTPALASCLVPNAANGGPVAMQLLSWQAGQPPAAALWQLQLANGGKSPGLTKPYNILNAQNPTLALQATSAGGGYAVSMAALTTSTYFDWTFKTLTLP